MNAEARALAGVHTLLAARRVTDAARVRLSELARAEVALKPTGIEVGAPISRAGSVAVAFAFAENPAERFVVVAEAALAADLCMRALKRKSPKLIDPKRAAPDALAGAFGAFVAAAARATTAGTPLVHWCGDASDLGPAGLAASVADVRLLVRIENDSFEAHLLAPLEAVLRAPAAAFARTDLDALGETPIALPLVVAACAISADVVSALDVGDVFVPSSFPKRVDGGFRGELILAAAGAERGLCAKLGEDGTLVRGNGSEEIATSIDAEVATVDAGESVPVVVRVEVGHVTLRAREWAALQSGDVVATGQKLGGLVLLRVGAAEVARGELVDCEGEIGVRILSRS